MSKGGELLGKGSYGCVFKPGLKCKGDKSKKGEKTLSKIYFRDKGLEEATSEYYLNSKIKEIKNYDKWASIYTRKCSPTSYDEMLTEDPEVDDCKNLYNNPNIVMLQGEYGGEDLDAYMVDNVYNNYNNSSFIDKYHTYLCMFKNVLKGLSDMNKHNMCHMDIKYGNLVINKGIIKLIDFGLSNNSANNVGEINKRAYSELHHISRFYPPYPPEYIYSCTYYDYEKILNKELEMLKYGEYRSYHDLLKNIQEELIQDVPDFGKYIKNLIIDNLENPLSNEEKKDLYDKVDIYSIGMLFIYLFKHINEKYDIIDEDVIRIFNNPKIRPFIDLSMKMMALNYKDRISADEAYKEYCEILRRFKSPKKRGKRRNKNTKNRRKNSNKKEKPAKKR